jgi:site-specific DNA-adenine methylase
MKSLKTPLRYPGGKSRAITKMSRFLPDMSKYKEYREPFLGGGSVALYMTKTYPHLEVWVNDLYEPLANFWQQLQDEADEITTRLRTFKTAYSTPEKAKELFLESKELVGATGASLVTRAVSFYIVNKCSFSGLTESSSFSKQASESNFSLRGIEKLPEYSKIIQNWVITNLSYDRMITDEKQVFTYFDPPYEIGIPIYGKRGEMHKYFDHDQFAKDCDAHTNHQMISYNSTQVVKNRFKDWNAAEFDHTYSMRTTGDYMKEQAKRKELVLTNYSV